MSIAGAQLCEDPLLSVIGQNGKWQLGIFLILTMNGIPAAWNMLAIAFMAPDGVDHWCARPNHLRNLSTEDWKQLAVPTEMKGDKLVYRRCKMYDLEYSELSAEVATSIGDHHTTALINCRTWTREDGSKQTYEYDLSRFSDTIINAFDLVCDDKEMVAHAQSTYMVGILFGALLGGVFADWFGRRTILLMFTVSLLVSGVAASFAPTITAFMALRFLVAFSMMAIYTTSFVYIIEQMGGKWRAFYGVCFGMAFSTGFVTLPIIAYVVNSWRKLELCIILPCVTLSSYYILLPESPRWLLSQKREKEARVIIKKICLRNKRDYKDSVSLTDQHAAALDDAVKKPTLVDLFRTPRLRWRTLNLYYNWFVISLVYYGLSLNSGNLGGDLFVNNLILGAVEFPGILMCVFLVMHTGRRWILSMCLLLGGAACLGTMIFEKGLYTLDWPIVTFAMIGKFFISSSFSIVYIFSAELFPTVLRTTGVGSSSMCARFGSISAPYLSFYGLQIYRYLPVVCFGVTSILAGLLAIFLPETKGKSLPNTLEEGEKFGTSAEQNGRNGATTDDCRKMDTSAEKRDVTESSHS